MTGGAPGADEGRRRAVSRGRVTGGHRMTKGWGRGAGRVAAALAVMLGLCASAGVARAETSADPSGAPAGAPSADSAADEILENRQEYMALGKSYYTLDCAKFDCKGVLPGAVRFAPVTKPFSYAIGYDSANQVVGWVALSTDVVDIDGYSGKPLVTLVGLNPKGVIVGTDLIHYDEPILLAGIPAARLFDLVGWYVGKSVMSHFVVGDDPAPGTLDVHVISGATVTTISQNATILETARRLGETVGIIGTAASVAGHFVNLPNVVWDWPDLVSKQALGHLVVTNQQMGQPASDQPFVDLYFAIADPPQVGRSLLGDGQYNAYMSQLQPGEHMLVVFNSGSQSFTGSAFVRGGTLDRVHLEQSFKSITFTDQDYDNLSGTQPLGGPYFNEAGLLIVRKGLLDLGLPFDFVFLGSVFTNVGYQRDYKSFRTTFRLPPAEYVVVGGGRDRAPESEPLWKVAWGIAPYKTAIAVAYLLLVMSLFAGRRWLTRSMKWLRRIHTAFLVASFVGLGLWLEDQPSVTQILTLVGTVQTGWRGELFLSEPLLFVTWIFIAIVIVVWGRGVFCGWVCPYGAATELLHRVGKRLKLKQVELPDRVHRRARWFRYGVLVVLIAVYFVSPVVAELLTVVEPFKMTFLVNPWSQPAPSIAWWLLLFAAAMFVFRPFCRYLCPLGAGLAVLSRLRLAGPYRRNFCAHCQICARGCEPQAIRENGTIDSMECLNCMECETNYQDRKVCPPLVGLDRLAGQNLPPAEAAEHLEKLRRDRERWRAAERA